MSRSLRRLASVFLAATLLFAQLAVSVYACPTLAPLPASTVALDVQVAECPDFANANLCSEHCAYGSASVDTLSFSLPSVDLVLLPWRIALAPSMALPIQLQDWRLSRSMHPPPPILFGTLRI